MSSSDRARRPLLNRRQLLGGATGLLGTAALSTLFRKSAHGAQMQFTPKAKRVVYLFMSGAPSQLETFDHNPGLARYAGTELPASVRGGQALTGMTATQGTFPIVVPSIGFRKYGEVQADVSDYLPHIGGIVDKISIVRSMHTDVINHDPAMTLMQTGSMLPGRPSFGAWVSYALGEVAQNLPSFVVLLSSSPVPLGQPLTSRYWGNGFMPSVHQGTQFQGGVAPVLYLDDGAGLSDHRRARLRGLRDSLDGLHRQGVTDAVVDGHIHNFELAGRMQTSVPDLVDLSTEGESTYALYGEAARVPGTFAWNCLMARRLLQRDVPFVQIYHRDWDHHANLPSNHTVAARDVDQASAALVLDLERNHMLDDTIVLWGGEFGRTVFSQGVPAHGDYGRDHHPRCFSMWMAGGGLKAGQVYGTTDVFSYNIEENPVHVHDLHATLLQLLGFDHTLLTYRSQGRDFRLTDVAGTVVPALFA